MPPYLVGKTPLEAAHLVDQFQRTAPPAPVPTYQPPVQTQTVGRPTQDEWALNPHDAYQREQAWRDSQVYQPAIQQTYNIVAEQSRALAQITHKDAFDRFGPEIELELRNLAPNQRTMQAYDYAVNIVKGRHAHEIQDDLVKQRVEAEIQKRIQAGGIVRPDAGGNGPMATDTRFSLTADDLPARFKEQCQQAGVTPQSVDNFLLTTRYYGQRPDGTVDLNKAREEYFAVVKRGGIITEGSR